MLGLKLIHVSKSGHVCVTILYRALHWPSYTLNSINALYTLLSRASNGLTVVSMLEKKDRAITVSHWSHEAPLQFTLYNPWRFVDYIIMTTSIGHSTVCSTVCSGQHQRKHKTPDSGPLWWRSGDWWIPLTKWTLNYWLLGVGTHWWLVDSPIKRTVIAKAFPWSRSWCH